MNHRIFPDVLSPWARLQPPSPWAWGRRGGCRLKNSFRKVCIHHIYIYILYIIIYIYLLYIYILYIYHTIGEKMKRTYVPWVCVHNPATTTSTWHRDPLPLQVAEVAVPPAGRHGTNFYPLHDTWCQTISKYILRACLKIFGSPKSSASSTCSLLKFENGVPGTLMYLLKQTHHIIISCWTWHIMWSDQARKKLRTSDTSGGSGAPA